MAMQYRPIRRPIYTTIYAVRRLAFLAQVEVYRFPVVIEVVLELI